MCNSYRIYAFGIAHGHSYRLLFVCHLCHFRKPLVSSVEMERKMAGRKLIRLSQLQDKLASVNLEETDWVTFGVIIKKITPQSSSNVSRFVILHSLPFSNFAILRHPKLINEFVTPPHE